MCLEMQPPHQHMRINLVELKALLARKLGPEKSRLYFRYLNKFLSLKLNKVEFNKLCLGIVGRENIPLHNEFIRSILKNAFSAKVPPPTNVDATRAVENGEPSSDLYQQNGSHPAIKQPPNPLAFSNGDILPQSPRKARTGTRERRVGDRRSTLGANGKTDLSTQQLLSTHCVDFKATLDYRESTLPDIQRPVQHHQGLRQQRETKGVLGDHDTQLPIISANDKVSVRSKDGTDVSARRLLKPPLGIPFSAASVGGARRALPLSSSSNIVSPINSGGLSDTTTLRERMEQIASTQGLEGVSMDCANMLNNGLDVYLKGLIRSCLELVGARSRHEPVKDSSHKLQTRSKLVNGIRPGHHFHMHDSSRPPEVMRSHKPHSQISLLDFKVAMELNPQQLGEDWPLLLEKICTQAFEEET